MTAAPFLFRVGPLQGPESSNLLLAAGGLTTEAPRPFGHRVSLANAEMIHAGSDAADILLFPETAVVTVVATLRDGTSVEVVTVGREGMVGFISPRPEGRALLFRVDVAGTAIVASREAFQAVLEDSAAMQHAVLTHMESQMIASAQLAVCHRLHHLSQRLARWILLNADRAGTEYFSMTQERLAEILGVRRPAVSLAAGEFMRKGLIRYLRGEIIIDDRPKLLLEACECYEDLASALRRSQSPGQASSSSKPTFTRS